MLQVARLAPTLLGDSKDLVDGFFRDAQRPDGSFQDRAGNADLYYTVFGLEGLLALSSALPERTAEYLKQFGSGEALDFIHLSCLARAWQTVSPSTMPDRVRETVFRRLDEHRSGDGGYALTPGSDAGSAYACFIALGLLEDLGGDIDADGLRRCLEGMRAADGGYANYPEALESSTPSTAAAVMILHQLGDTQDSRVGDWLFAQCHPEGGFFAVPGSPMPDLLSTATALHALVALQRDIEPLREPCLDFVDTLWTNSGGFYGNWADDFIDCEYTYYGLLALGHLSL
jgi:prenyltransferase beta subunit